jgi:hypothetical protein
VRKKRLCIGVVYTVKEQSNLQTGILFRNQQTAQGKLKNISKIVWELQYFY